MALRQQISPVPLELSEIPLQDGAAALECDALLVPSLVPESRRFVVTVGSLIMASR